MKQDKQKYKHKKPKRKDRQELPEGESEVVESGGCAPPVITYRRYRRRDMRAED